MLRVIQWFVSFVRKVAELLDARALAAENARLAAEAAERERRLHEGQVHRSRLLEAAARSREARLRAAAARGAAGVLEAAAAELPPAPSAEGRPGPVPEPAAPAAAGPGRGPGGVPG